MNNNISPEEKLLRLIRGRKKPEIPLEGKDKDSATTKQFRPAHKNPASSLAIPQKTLAINNVIFIVFVVSCIYLLASFIYPLLFLRKIRLPQIKPEKIIEASKGPAGKAKPLAFYLNNIKNRAVFGIAEDLESSAGVIDRDLTENINLVGIISGENPQAVIEDKKTGKTYYLTKGQLLGEFQLEDIQEGKVILNYKGHRYGLYL